MVLLDITSQEVSWTIGNMITAGGLIGGSISFIIKIKIDKVNHDAQITALQVAQKSEVKAINLELKKQAETILNNKQGKYAMKRELEELIREKEQNLHARVDRVRDDNIKSYEKLEDKISDLDKKNDLNTSRIIEAITSKK